MKMLERSVVIKASPETVFSYLDKPENLPEIWPSLIEVRDVKELPAGGHQFHFLYKMAGRRFEGDTETIEFERNKHAVTKSTGEIPSKFEWDFIPENGSTRFTLKAEYEIPQTLFAKLTDPVLTKINEHEADAFVANLKDRVEA